MRTLLIITLVAIPSLVAAQQDEDEIPHRDIFAICKTAGDFGGRQICNDLERGAYNELKRAWPLASKATQAKVLEKSSAALKCNNYYQVLVYYLDKELTAENIEHLKPLNPPRSCYGLPD